MDTNNNCILERKARIFNLQKYNMYDGPGVRTLVFFQGCPLRCKWCSNPEGLLKSYCIMYRKNVCINCGKCVEVCPANVHKFDSEGNHYIDRNEKCIGCRECEKNCPTSALTIMGEEKNISELYDVIEEDKAFYDTSGGGVTLGGGEVSMQHEAASSLLMTCQQNGINTAIETCGHCKTENFLQLAEYVDLFLFDIKQINSEKHYNLTGVRNELILNNLVELLKGRFNVKIRMPLLKNLNDSNEDIKGVIEFLKPYKDLKNFKGIDLLPYHKLGVHKYEQLDMVYPLGSDINVDLTEEDLQRIENLFKDAEFNVEIIRH